MSLHFHLVDKVQAVVKWFYFNLKFKPFGLDFNLRCALLRKNTIMYVHGRLVFRKIKILQIDTYIWEKFLREFGFLLYGYVLNIP